VRQLVNIREIREDDAATFLNLLVRVDEETEFMLLEAGERQITVEDQRQRIKTILSRDNQTILVAENDHDLIGYLAVIGGDFKRNRHRAYIVIGILQAFTDQKIGTKLFRKLEEWTRHHAVHRLELTVMAHNERAISLYKKMGFEIEGTKKHSLLISGSYVDEYYMAKLIP
jgi:RimJ/RimL family protein N-acetyltransferase